MSRKPTPNFSRFDFDRFVNSTLAQDLDYTGILQAFDRECGQVEASLRGRGAPQARADGGYPYIARLKRVLFWLHHGQLADNGQEAGTCHRIATILVEKGNFKPEALNDFGGRPHNL